MTRVLIAEGCREVDFGGRRYYARDYQQGGSFDMPDAAARQAVRIGGAIASVSGCGSRKDGYRCPACGFGSWVKICSRCGAECVRE
jgi:hypothetical protein